MVADWISQPYQDRSPNSSSKRLVNLYFQSTEGEGKTQAELIGTPGTTTFTRSDLPDIVITVIQGNGGVPNEVTVTTAADHGLSVGSVFNISGTTNYDEPNLVVSEVLSLTQFKYETLSNTNFTADVTGEVEPTGESPITDIPANSSCRGLYTTSTSQVYGCFGGEVIEFFIDGTWALRYSLGVGSSQVSFADDGINVVFCDGTQMGAVNLTTNAITNITSSLPFVNPTKLVFSNGRIVAINADDAVSEGYRNFTKVWYSNLYDALTWEVLSFFSTESSADANISLEVREGEMWFFGPRSYEVWRPDTNPDLPFVKVGGSSTEIGCGAEDSTTSIAGQIFWLGSSTAGENVVFMSNGYGAQRISTHALEYFLNNEGAITNDAVGFSYQQEGHTFYILNFIQSNRTFVYDLNNAKWHERSTRDQLVNLANRWEPLYATFAFNQVLVGALNNPRLLLLDLNKYTEWDGRPIVRTHQGPVIFQDLQTLFFSELNIDMETGVGRQQGEPYQSGIQTGYAENPQVILQHSDDGGHTWSSERKTSAGKVGQYRARVRFRRLGRSRERVFRVVISDPVKVHILGARVTATVGANP
jgi:hypothetical protein